MELWVTEYQTPSLGLTCKVKDTLATKQTEYQHLAVVDTEQFGRMLFLDGMVMTNELDEYVYHEMITQIALNSHPNPEKVLIIGGGDGGALREAVRHPLVKEATLVEIDGEVIQSSRDFFPGLSLSFDDPKAKVIVDDGVNFVKDKTDSFDIVIVDSTEPIGPAAELFSEGFYRSVHKALKEDGMLVVQSESPFFNRDVIQMVNKGISKSFAITKLYLASVPTYPSGLWSFTVGSKVHDPEKVLNKPQLSFKYYSSELHQAAFVLPAFVKQIMARGSE